MGQWPRASCEHSGSRKHWQQGARHRHGLLKKERMRELTFSHARSTTKQRNATNQGTNVMERISTIKPGFLVSICVTLRGGVSYSRVDLAAEERAADDVKVEKWETTKVVTDATEHERAKKVQSTIGGILRRTLVPFGRGG